MSKTELTITISPAPGTRNKHRGRHWGKYVKEKKRVAKEVKWQTVLGGCGRGGFCFHHARVHLTRTGWNKLDPTGLWESVKPVLDALVDYGVIPNDSEEYVSLGETEQVIQRKRPGWSELVVRLEEIDV